MTQMEKARRNLHLYLIALMVCGWAVLVPLVAPLVESYVYPVLTDARAVRVAQDGDRVSLAMYGVRHRPACQYQDIVALVAEPGKLPVAAQVETPFGKGGKPVSRPPGPQSFGEWRVSAPPGASVTFVLRYECHSLWDTMAQIGPVRTP